MKYRFSLLTLLLVIPILFTSCASNEPTEYVAKLTTVSELNNTAGFSWLEPEIATYTVDTNVINSIKTSWQSNQRQFTVFVNPSCSCEGTKKLFPHFIRVLRDAGIPESAMKIYSMRSSSDKLPDDVKAQGFTIEFLPTIYIRNNGSNVKVITANPVNSTIESEILQSLQ
ncbi:MAG: hypothetical protein JNL36_04895 [Candidatus Kapabacteria bacterium]|nr:hypothetical protein [Candidatus Kapabacteria bacterium]